MKTKAILARLIAAMTAAMSGRMDTASGRT